MATNKFYYILNQPGKNRQTVGLLRQACESRGIECVEVISKGYDLLESPAFKPGDMLYKISTDQESTLLYRLWAARFPIVTVFESADALLANGDGGMYATITHERAGVPINKTIFNVPRDRTLLDKYVESLGGFPVIVKAMGGSHGVGVMRIDSRQSLYSVADYLSKQDGTYIMRQYVDHDRSARLIVVGDKVVDSIAYDTVKNDFRTNAGENLTVEVTKFSDEIEQAAVLATNSLGSGFGGVDIMIDKEGGVHVAEVNIPCYFPRCQLASGTDIAGQLVDLLMKKSEAQYGKQ